MLGAIVFVVCGCAGFALNNVVREHLINFDRQRTERAGQGAKDLFQLRLGERVALVLLQILRLWVWEG